MDKGKDDVTFKDNMELVLAKPTLTDDGSIAVMGNFDVLKEKIKDVVEKYKGTKLTDENVGYVKAVHGQFVKLRTGIEAKRKEWKKLYIQTPGELLDALCNDLKGIAEKGESALAQQLDAYDQRRIDELTVVLQEYADEAARNHELREEYAKQIVLKKQYYNKTAKEEESADDIEAQAAELGKKQKEYDAGLALIDAELEGTMLLRDTYVSQLAYRSAMEIVLKIKQDKKESQRLYEEVRRKEEEGKTVTLGEPVSEGVRKVADGGVRAQAVKGEDGLRERKLWIRYRSEQADLISDFFEEHGIQYKFVKD